MVERPEEREEDQLPMMDQPPRRSQMLTLMEAADPEEMERTTAVPVDLVDQAQEDPVDPELVARELATLELGDPEPVAQELVDQVDTET